MASSNISGLREQIISNAAAAYPISVQQHLFLNNTGIIKPAEIFDVLIMPEYPRPTANLRFRAVITVLHPESENRLHDTFTSATGATMEEAMMGLLIAMGEIAMHNIEGTREVPMAPAIGDDTNGAIMLEQESKGQLDALKEAEGHGS